MFHGHFLMKRCEKVRSSKTVLQVKRLISCEGKISAHKQWPRTQAVGKHNDTCATAWVEGLLANAGHNSEQTTEWSQESPSWARETPSFGKHLFVKADPIEWMHCRSAEFFWLRLRNRMALPEEWDSIVQDSPVLSVVQLILEECFTTAGAVGCESWVLDPWSDTSGSGQLWRKPPQQAIAEVQYRKDTFYIILHHFKDICLICFMLKSCILSASAPDKYHSPKIETCNSSSCHLLSMPRA